MKILSQKNTNKRLKKFTIYFQGDNSHVHIA